MLDVQESIDDATIRQAVQGAGVDMARFDKDLQSAELAAVIDRDREEADAAKVDGTPTLFVNGLMVEFDNLEDALKAAK